MTQYSGTLSIQLSGVAEGRGSFTASFIGSYSAGIGKAHPFHQLMPVLIYSGNASGSGTLTTTLTMPEEVDTGSSSVSFQQGVYYSMTPDLPVDPLLAQYGLALTLAPNFNSLHTEATLSGTGSFDAVLDGVRLTGTATASGSLMAEVPAYSIAALDAVGPEGTGTGRVYTFTIARLSRTAESSSIGWVVDGDATDFAGLVLPSGTVDFAPGETSHVVSVTVLGDAFYEGDESFVVRLAPYGGDNFDGVATSALGLIENDDEEPGIISIAALNADRAEGVTGATDFTFILTREGASSGSASVGWQVQGSGLRPADGADFVGGVLPGGSVDFAPGETSKVLTVSVVGDELREAHEGFTVTLTAQSAVVLGTASAEGVIRADEALDDIVAVDPSTGLAYPATPQFYSGPVAGVERELLALAPAGQRLTVVASGENWFIHTGDGDDAIAVAGGRNVLDGGLGSNFLIGASGADSFFVDARAGWPVWSTMVGFGPGDDVTIWGVSEVTASLSWVEGAGATGYTGLTLHAQYHGEEGFVSMTLPGFTAADLTAGHLQVSSSSTGPTVWENYLYLAWV